MEIYLILGVYVLLLVLISKYFSGKTKESFIIADRNRSTWEISFSKFAQTAGIGLFISYGAYMYQYGISTISMILGMIVSYVIFALWVSPKIYKESKEKKFLTHGDYVKSRTNNITNKILIDSVVSLTIFIWLLMTFIGGAKVVSILGIMSYDWALVLNSLIILIYLLISGFRAIIVTDILQSFLILILVFIAISSFFINGQLEFEEIFNLVENESMPVMLIFGLFTYGLFSVFSAPDRFQLVYSAKDEKSAKKGMLYSIFPAIIISLFILIVSYIVKNINNNLDPDLAFITFIFEYVSTSFIPFAAIIIFAGLMSSADTNIFNLSSYLNSIFNIKNKTIKISRQRLIMILIVFITIVLAFFFRNIVDVVVIAAGMTVATSVAMIYILKGGKNFYKFNLSIVFGIIGLIVGIMLFGVSPDIAVFPIIFGLIPLLIPDRFFKNK